MASYDSKTDKICKKFKKPDLEKKIMEIIDKKWTYNQLIKSAYPEQREEFKKERADAAVSRRKIKKLSSGIHIVLDEDKYMNYTLCNECKPKSPQKIIGKT
ncbi:hypothetical protein KKG31_06120 [Patescibacteria group bacterium]|nr:hypothetical protein [Patescibacteria group bacterium]MBU1758675.1 hypothetical protein [Patescibacteria group bacterium]